MNTGWVNRGILIAMAAIGAIVYVALYDHASTNFRLYVPLGLIVLVALVVRDAVRDRKR